jgi:DNA (cytosine-5)-methyltransferase 1
MQGDLIRRERKKKRLSQAKLARLLGIRQALLSSWELNKSEPSPETLKEILNRIERIDNETVAILRKRSIKKGAKVQHNRVVSSKNHIRNRAPLTEVERKARLPFLYLDADRTLCNGRKSLALFSGIGGLSLGFRFAGFQIVGYVEIYEPFRRIFEANFPHVKCLGHDIRNIRNEELLSWKRHFGDIDSLFGGPPCQGFSLAGKRDRFDERNQLYEEFVRVASILKPKTVVMENVSLMTSMKNPDGRPMPEVMSEAFNGVGYDCYSKILYAEDYGVPQARRRLFMLGVRKNLGIKKVTFPSPTHGAQSQLTLLGNSMKPYVTFWEATGDLQSLEAGEFSPNDHWHKATPHPDYIVKMLKNVPEGMSAHSNPDPALRPTSGYNTTYKRIKWDEPCSTISTNFNMISGCRHVHPSDTRALTVREAMRVQTFPDNFEIFGKIDDVRKGIGNAVPPILAMRIADHLNKCILNQIHVEYSTLQ